MTSMEREEKEKGKKREKKLEDEETMQQATWVKYTIPIKHQVNLGSLSSQVLFGLL
jgi:nucleosome-remodeling factor subunit BPTF